MVNITKHRIPCWWYLVAFLLLAIVQMPLKTNTNNEPEDKRDEDIKHTHALNQTISSKSDTLLYANDREKFSETFASCIDDPSCRILYNHLQKTGGSYLASRLHPVLDENGKRYNSNKWCCGDGLYDRFINRTKHFCELKFSIYETYNVQMFADILQTCQQYTEKRTREVALITIREPIERTLSQINMRCNKGYNRLSNNKKEICQRCNYTSDPKYFDHYVNQTNELYVGLEATIPTLVTMLKKRNRVHNNEKVVHTDKTSSNLLILDNSQINSFFDEIEHLRNITLPKGRGNVGYTRICDFEMTSNMIYSLQPALDVYENLIRLLTLR